MDIRRDGIRERSNIVAHDLLNRSFVTRWAGGQQQLLQECVRGWFHDSLSVDIQVWASQQECNDFANRAMRIRWIDGTGSIVRPAHIAKILGQSTLEIEQTLPLTQVKFDLFALPLCFDRVQQVTNADVNILD